MLAAVFAARRGVEEKETGRSRRTSQRDEMLAAEIGAKRGVEEKEPG